MSSTGINTPSNTVIQKDRNSSAGFFRIVGIVFILLMSPGCVTLQGGKSFQLPTGLIVDSELTELSGIVPAQTPNQYWAHNDSGHSNRIFKFDETGQVLGSVVIADSKNKDWEAMLRVDEENLLIADVGDNDLKRDRYQIYLMKEPNLEATSGEAVRIDFLYPKGRSVNCEAVFIMEDRLYLIAKKNLFASSSVIYCLDELIPGRLPIARKVGRMPIKGSVTDACYNAESKELAVLTYTGVSFFKVDGETDLLKASSQKIVGLFGQCEAICFDREFLVIANEAGRIWKHPRNAFNLREKVVERSANSGSPGK